MILLKKIYTSMVTFLRMCRGLVVLLGNWNNVLLIAWSQANEPVNALGQVAFANEPCRLDRVADWSEQTDDEGIA